MNIGIAGLGTVGAEVARQLITHQASLEGRAGQPLSLTAVSARVPDRDRGFKMDGIDFEPDPMALSKRDDIDLVIELIGGDESPARYIIEEAIKNGKSVVTANKALLSKHGAHLVGMAEEKGVAISGEAAVAGGIPALKLVREGLAANHIDRISGILNGTCNYILSVMEKTGRDFEDVLSEAQAKGYAESDPSFDIDGIDAAHKLSLLSAIAFGRKPALERVAIQGITNITALDIKAAAELGFTIRLLAVCERIGEGVNSSVQPCLVPSESGLAKVDGATNAVEIIGRPIGSVMATGPGAGAGATASAVLADIIEVAAGRTAPFFGCSVGELVLDERTAKNTPERTGHYFMRLMVEDRPGVLADVTGILSEVEASVASIVQHDDDGADIVPIILTTHEITESNFKKITEKISSLESVVTPPNSMIIMGHSA